MGFLRYFFPFAFRWKSGSPGASPSYFESEAALAKAAKIHREIMRIFAAAE
jgi:hypothetical protein